MKKWAKVGKVTAWAVGAAAALGVVYGAGALVYSVGKDDGTMEAEKVAAKESRAREESLTADYNGKLNQASQEKDQLAKEQEAALKKLVQEGRLIPEDSCLRYAVGKIAFGYDSEEIVSGSDCGLEMRLSWRGTVKKPENLTSFSAAYGDNKAVFKPGTDYAPATVDLQVRKKAEWVSQKK